MIVYIGVIIAIVLLSSILLIYTLNKNSLLNTCSVLAIAMSSILVSSIVPFIFIMLVGSSSEEGVASNFGLGILGALIVTFILYITLIFVMTILISLFISDKRANSIINTIKKSMLSSVANKMFKRIGSIIVSIRSKLWGGSEKEDVTTPKDIEFDNYEFKEIKPLACVDFSNPGIQTDENAKNQTDEIYDTDTSQNDINYLAIEGLNIMSEQEQDMLEKLVDSEQNIDKMGVEVFKNNNLDLNSEINTPVLFEELIETDKEVVPLDINMVIDTVKLEKSQEEFDVTADYYNDSNYSVDELVENEEAIFEEAQEDEEVLETSLSEEDDVSFEKAEEMIILEKIPFDLKNNVEEVAITGEDDFKSDTELTEEYIDEGFRLKESGDLEGAILYYMYALDKNPEKDVAFWIVLDTCVLYKELGQTELAREILQSYIVNYGDLMDISVKVEIERNLASI